MELQFAAPEANQSKVPHKGGYWNILVVDDETEVHTITAMVLKKFQFKQQPLKLIDAYSASEAINLLSHHEDIAMVLLDVVMEEDNSGFKVVDFIRNSLNNSYTQIILRTGQAGSISEEESMLSYEINGFKEKTELSASHLISTTIASLRAYHLLQDLQNQVEEKQNA